MILAFLLSFSAYAQTEVQIGQYYHARAEAELVHYLESKDIDMATVLEQDEKLTCTNLEPFEVTLNEVKAKASEILTDFRQEGEAWRSSTNYGENTKIVREPKHMMGYLSERLRFTKLEAFGRLAKLSLGCLDVFRADPAVARNIKEVPRFRVESINNVSTPLFCQIAVRYWKEVNGKLPANCRRTED